MTLALKDDCASRFHTYGAWTACRLATVMAVLGPVSSDRANVRRHLCLGPVERD